MVSRYFWVLSGLCIFALFATWDLRLQYTLKQFERAQVPCYTIENVTQPDDVPNTNVSSIVPKPRVLCWILTGPKNHMTKAIHVKRTWGSRCDKLLFMSSVEDPQLGTVALQGVEEGHDKLWPKTQKAFQYIWEHHKNDADWFLKADDDTYVFVDNLRKFLKDYDPTDPHYFGALSKFYESAPPINFGGAGYVLSREAVRRFVDIALAKGGGCFTGFRTDFKGDEDTELGLCLRSVGVPPEWTLDKQRRNRFWWGNPLNNFKKMAEDYQRSWDKGPMRASNRPISFHRVSPHELYVLEYLTHYLKTDY